MGLTGAAAVPAEGDPADLAEQLRRERETVAQLRAQVDRMVHERTSALDERTRILLDVDREEEFLYVCVCSRPCRSASSGADVCCCCSGAGSTGSRSRSRRSPWRRGVAARARRDWASAD